MVGVILALAPMQDVTDLAFMRTLARVGSLPDLLVTPYFRSTPTTCALAEQNLRCIEGNETGVPIQAQLAGSDATALVRDARHLLTLPVSGINLNAGCPSPLVNRHGAGAGLLREPDNFRAVLQALRQAVPAGKFSVKCRLGWADDTEFAALLELLSEAKPDMLTVHARTRKDLYGGKPRFEHVRRAVRAMDCPVLANGDLQTPEQVLHCLEVTDAAGVMIGRGAVRNPFIFRQLRGGEAPTQEEMRDYYRILVEETGRILFGIRTEKGHCNRMKKYLAFCYPDFTAEQEYALRRCTVVEEMLRLLGGT